MRPIYLVLIAGWTAAAVFLAIVARSRKWILAVAGLIVFALALSVLVVRENRQSDSPTPVGSFLKPHFDYLLTTTNKRFQGKGEPLPRSIEVEIYKKDLGFAVSMAWAPGTDDIFFTEREGAVRVLDGTELVEEPCVELPVNATGENDGLLGIELSPTFDEDRFVYVYYTDSEENDSRLVRFTVSEDFRCEEPTTIIDGIPVSELKYKRHNGGQFEFVGGKLFVATGEGDDSRRAQDLTSLGGKILRLEADGSPAPGNPFEDEEGAESVWAYGLRNPFGLAVGPEPELLYSVDNGPYCSDEINLIRPGANFGWGNGFKSSDCGGPGLGRDPTAPIHTWDPTIAPTDPYWYSGPLEEMDGLLMGDFNFGFLHRFEISADGTSIVSEDLFQVGSGYRILDVSNGPGGWPYLVAAGPGDAPGYILRLVSH
ncbi:MAG TPA: PQQ-dependent sugar dehydrogenase [Actinomycetota bacterium]|nr:PQQ-dependent sugar dehydrogenase [Actinomycetota bacterium]